MRIEIREADLDKDRQLLIDTLLRYLTEGSDGRRYDWLYLNNPHGRAKTWIATDGDNGTMVGVASSFPRRIHFDRKRETVWVLGDFCINSDYRSLGPALALQKACLRRTVSTTRTFCYDFPNTGMAAIYKRIGIEPMGAMVRLARPLRVDRVLERTIKFKPLVRGLAVAGNAWLKLTSPKAKSSGDLEVASHEGECGEEFSRLASRVGYGYGICVDRSAEYLNWRYLAAPLNRFEISTVRDRSSLLGYAVYEQRGSNATIADLFAVEDPPAVLLLVGRVIELLRNRGVVTVSLPILESHRWVPWMRKLGFHPRESSPVFVYAPEDSLLNPEGKEWFLMCGDRDS